MKLTVIFDSVRVIVPCGNGDLTVSELIERAVSRYRKATNKRPGDHVQVQVLETSEDHGILDPDDIVCDVVDDRDKLVAIYEERPASGPGKSEENGQSVSHNGTTCPDLFQGHSSNFHEETKTIKMFPIVRDILENDGNKTQIPPSKKVSPPPVPPKPQSKKGPRTSLVESTPSEDSGIFQDDRTRIGSDSSKSEANESLSPPMVALIKTSETAFVAVATRTPVQSTIHFNDSNDRRRLSSAGSDHLEVDHDSEEDESFSLGRNVARKSMFVDDPMLDRWAELQEQRMYEMVEDDRGSALSPSEERHYDQTDFSPRTDEYLASDDSESSGESGYIMIELEPENYGDLGVHVVGYKTADGRELGLIVQDISPNGCAARDGRLQVADRIVEVNRQSVMDLTNEQAEGQFALAMSSPVVSLGISRSHTFVPGQRDVDSSNTELNNELAEEQRSESSEEPIVRRARASTLEKLIGGEKPSPAISAAPLKKVNKRVLLELNKGSDGLGFSITTRDNHAGGNAPIFVKSILAKGAAIVDGRLRAGDRILEVNGIKMTGKSQGEAVNILRGTSGLVKLVVQREEVSQPSQMPSVETKEESFNQSEDDEKQILTFKIALDVSGAAGLGVSVKGKARTSGSGGRDSPEENGIYVKSIIAGGAAAKDRRLQSDDQLLQVNGVSLVRMSNPSAMNTLRQAMQSTMPGQAFIEVVIAREKEDETDTSGLQKTRSLEMLNTVGRERPIEVQADDTPPPPREFASADEEDGKVEDVEQRKDEDEDEDDEFSPDPVHLNLSSVRDRNAVKRNDSYCVAINKNQTPGKLYSPITSRNRVDVHSSPLAATKVRVQVRAQEISPAMSTSTPLGPRSVYAKLSEGVISSTPTSIFVPVERPTSTVAVPTPPVGSTKGTPSRHAATPPQPPPRWDSVASDTTVEQRLIQHLSAANSGGLNGSTIPAPPPPRIVEDLDESGVVVKGPPSYEQALVRSRRSSHHSESLSSDGGRSSREDRRSWSLDNLENDSAFVPESPLSDQNPFSREGFGRQSMSEKRGRGTLDAKQSEFYVKREQQRSSESVNSSSTEESPRRKPLPKTSLKQVHSAGLASQRINNGFSPMQKSISTGNLSQHRVCGPEKRVMSDDNLSFTSAVEYANKDIRDIQNGHARLNHSDEGQDHEIPITMTSNAAFNDVQQKLTKKPFYKGIGSVFKIGKGRRGDYTLAETEAPPFKHAYTKEALIDFPAEQRYRQLVHNYGQESDSWRSHTLPTRGHKKHPGGKNGGNNPAAADERPQPVKIGRITVTEPTRV